MLNSYTQNHGSIWQNGSMDNADIVAIRQNMACEATAVIADAGLHMISWMKINFSFFLSDAKINTDNSIDLDGKKFSLKDAVYGHILEAYHMPTAPHHTFTPIVDVYNVKFKYLKSILISFTLMYWCVTNKVDGLKTKSQTMRTFLLNSIRV